MKIRPRRILEPYSSLALVRGGAAHPLTLGVDAFVDMHVDPAPTVEAPLVFVGYGLSVPELHYDDLEGLDLHGKIAVILSGGPSSLPAPLRARCQSLEERHKLLRQRAGVFGIVTIQNPRDTGVPWDQRAGTRLEDVFSPADPAFEQDDELELAVTFNPDRADKLFEGSGHTLEELLALANAGKPLPRFALPATLRASVAVERSEGESQNVVGVLPGSDPRLAGEYVALTAHLDYRGKAPATLEEIGNASGAAALLEIAGMLHESPARLRRSLLFVFQTGEEHGSLGAEFFAQYPQVKAAGIVAELKVDMEPASLPLRAISVYGLNESDLGATVKAAGARKRVRIVADSLPQWDLAARSDQYSLIRRGVPAVAFRPEFAKPARMGAMPGNINEFDRADGESAASRFEDVVLEAVKAVANRPTRPRWLASSVFARFSR